LAEREAIERLMTVKRLISTADAEELSQKLGLQLDTVIPAREALGDLDSMPRIRAFYDHQVQPKAQPSNWQKSNTSDMC
jgi:hypothetical protein